MKKLFTFGIFLFFLVGIGSNVKATVIKSAGTPVAGLDWTNTAAWAGGVVPTSTDSVQIMTGDSVAVSTEVSCVYLKIDGTFYLNSKFHVNGDIVVNGTFNDKSTGLYCYNLYNYGRFWASSATGSSSSTRSLFIGCGFTLSGTTYTVTYPTGLDYVLVNDGRFGDFPVRAVANSVSGSGISLFLNTAANSITIKPSATGIIPVAFGISQILPATGTTTTNNFSLNIQEDVVLVKYSSSAAFSLQNSDTFSGTRDCNISSGSTLYIAGYLHTRNGIPSTNQGQMNYNVNGGLDLSTYSTASSTNEIQLYTSASSPSVAINVNATGTLIFGKAIKLTANAATGQTIAIKVVPGSNVKFGLPTGLAIPTLITATNVSFPLSLDNTTISNTNGVSLSLAGAAAQTIVGGNTPISALTINNTATTGVALSSSLTVTGALTLTTATAGKLSLGNNNLTVGSIVGATSTSYVVTDGTGKLSQTATTSGSLFPIGTVTGYAPVTITPAVSGVVSASVSATTTGTFTGYAVNANEWTLTSAAATTATLALTPTTATNTTSPVIFIGTGYADKIDATVSTATYTAAGISLPASATIFATGGTTLGTAVESNTANKLLVYAANKSLVVRNASVGDVVTVYGVTGLKVASSVVKADNTSMAVVQGIYLVKVGAKTTKVVVD